MLILLCLVISMSKTLFNDEWILKNVSNYSSWKKMFDVYFETFHYGTYRSFRNHLYNVLKLTRCFTKEQNEWIKKNYPVLGCKKATETFNSTFNCGRSLETIRGQACKLGVKVNVDRVNEIRKESNQKLGNGSRVIRGTSVKKGGITRETVWIKQDGVWKRESYAALGPVGKNQRVVHLNGDPFDNSKENLQIIDIKILGKMTANKMWSEDPVITKTGIICCVLEDIVKEPVLGSLTNDKVAEPPTRSSE